MRLYTAFYIICSLRVFTKHARNTATAKRAAEGLIVGQCAALAVVSLYTAGGRSLYHIYAVAEVDNTIRHNRVHIVSN